MICKPHTRCQTQNKKALFHDNSAFLTLTGLTVFMIGGLQGGFLFSWRNEAIVSRSRIEAGYKELANTTIKVMWIQSLLKELGIYVSPYTKLWCDNTSATFLTTNPMFQAH